VVVAMPCGYDAARAAAEVRPSLERLRDCGARTVVAVDASSYFSRPGPRLVDGLELLGHILHPERVPEPPPGAQALRLAADQAMPLPLAPDTASAPATEITASTRQPT
jgi:iron complex transport system substrate-binding protein